MAGVKLGLRVDVDTLRGTREGVPNLLGDLAAAGVRGSFFFSVGPDNMGRNLWRLLKPRFLFKMLRTKAASLYGWDILLCGTCWPGPLIGSSCGEIIRATAKAGHEVGLHAWDHFSWQAKISIMSKRNIYFHLSRGFQTLTDILGEPPTCSAVPGWRCTERVLKLKAEGFDFAYNSDCRGVSIFNPVVKGMQIYQPQIPVTLPTYDELLGRDGVTDDNYNERLLALVEESKLNVLTIHAEVEGRSRRRLFRDFLAKAQSMEIEVVPLGNLLKDTKAIPPGAIVSKIIPGREGWVACEDTV